MQNGRSPLHYASKYNRAGALKLLLAHKAVCTNLDNEARCALHFAAKYNAADALALLLRLMRSMRDSPTAVGRR
jgi:ankyrin repeat protein